MSSRHPLRIARCGARFRRRPIVLSRTHTNKEPWHSSRLAQRGRTRTDGKTGGAQRRCPHGQRQPPGSGDRFTALGREQSPASGGIATIAEIVAHTACTKRPRGPVLALCQHPRP